MVLKRRTSQNIVWGGIAGCMPVLIGWSAVTNDLSWAAVILFLVIFFWTPPHYWPLSMKVRDDYERVGVPMLPVVAGNAAVARQIVLYSWVMVAVSLLLCRSGYVGWFYTSVALASGGWWLWEAHAPARPGEVRGGGREAEGDAPVPLVDHVRVAAVRRGRDRPVPALTPPAPDSGPALPAAASLLHRCLSRPSGSAHRERTEGPDP